MPAPRLLPDDTVLRRLHAEGVSAAQVARDYGTSHAAVTHHWRRLNLPGAGVRHRVMPWTVATRHAHDRPADYVRVLAGVANGSRPADDARLPAALAWADDLARRGLAVTYARCHGFGICRYRSGHEVREFTLPGGRVTLVRFAVDQEAPA